MCFVHAHGWSGVFVARLPGRRIPRLANAAVRESTHLAGKKNVKQPSRERGDASGLLERITIDPDICHGKPCIRGLRYPVESILTLLSAGMSSEEILSDYDDLEPDDVLAALAFAARLSRVKRVGGARLPRSPS